MRAGRFEEAASSFRRVATEGPRAVRADAAYFHAVCLARAGAHSLAVAAFEQFLIAYPEHARIAEASVALGWLWVRDGQVDAARAAFERGRAASDPDVVAAAKQGLEATSARNE
ncbi:MAG: tetratricopeptide repeat protein [Myxococcota bacterium]